MTDAPVKTLVLASDHAGLSLKALIAEEMRKLGHKVQDLGPHTSDSVDYPDYANRMADFMKENAGVTGILICGSGIGISIAINRHLHIRAALCTDVTMARLSRQHNDANVVALGERLTGEETALQIVDAFLTTEFEGGRHQRRVDKMS